MASNRDPRKDYRINRRGRKSTSSADRSKRAKKASAPKPTSSARRKRTTTTAKVTSGSDYSRANRAEIAKIGREENKARNAKGRTSSSGRNQEGKLKRQSRAKVTRGKVPPSSKVKKTGLKLKGTWAHGQAEEMRLNKKAGANNLESSLMNDARLKGSTDAKEERAQRLRVRNKVVKGPGSKAVRKKPVTGPPRCLRTS